MPDFYIVAASSLRLSLLEEFSDLEEKMEMDAVVG